MKPATRTAVRFGVGAAAISLVFLAVGLGVTWLALREPWTVVVTVPLFVGMVSGTLIWNTERE